MPPPEKPPGDEMSEGAGHTASERLRTGGMVAIAVLITLFAVLNVNEVKVHWIIGSGHAPLIVVIVVSVLVGIVLTYMAERLNRRHRR
jgi:uncharacterized integral membrane protein